MNAILTLATKDLRLLARDPRSAIILLLMPLVLIIILGFSLGEVFGAKPDDRIRISIVNLDNGLPPNHGPYPTKPWAEVVMDDLAGTADIRLELIETREEAEQLVRSGDRAAVLIFEPDFSERMNRCSFLTKNTPPPLNPLYRDGILTEPIGLKVVRDPTRQTATAIIEQVAQVTLLRVVIPWMIGNAFEKVGDRMGAWAQQLITQTFSNYNFTAKTWAGLTKNEQRIPNMNNRSVYESDGSGIIKRGAARYQVLVPSYVVTFAFFLVLSGGWLFVAERRFGTLVRLRAAPLSRTQIILGKLIPCLVISLVQGVFLLVAGKLVFGMRWGPEPLALIPIVLSTAFAAVGLTVLVASMAKTETQLAVYGTLIVLVLAGLSGSLMPRDLMPEEMRQFSLLTPHAWALDAYSQLLVNPEPQFAIVWRSCLALCGFGTGFLSLALWRLRLD